MTLASRYSFVNSATRIGIVSGLLSNAGMEVEEVRRANLLALVRDYGGQRQLADAAKSSPAQISQWINRSPDAKTGKPRVMGSRAARAMESALSKPKGWMDQLHDDSTKVEPQALAEVASRETPDAYVRFPLLEGFAGMGRGDYMGDYPEIVEFVEVTREWAGQKLRGVPLGEVRVITGRGDSMRGQYNDGDLIFMDSRVKRFVGDSAYCFRLHGQVQIKRLQMVGRNLVRVLSANAAYPPLDVALEDVEIGGRALAAWTLTEF